MNKIELFNSALREHPVLTPQKIISQRRKTVNSDKLNISKYVILGFYPKLYKYINKTYENIKIFHINKMFPYYTFNYENKSITFIFPGMGAPLSVALLEESIVLGGEIFIFFGRAGTLKKNISSDEIIIPLSAVRDEGTSFHYEKPDRYSHPDKELVSAIIKTVQKKNFNYRTGLNWTTDGVYRETPEKIHRLKKEKCISVDMEASALFAAAKYHKKKTAGFFLPSDYVNTNQWTPLKKSRINPPELLKIALETIKYFSAIK